MRCRPLWAGWRPVGALHPTAGTHPSSAHDQQTHCPAGPATYTMAGLRLDVTFCGRPRHCQFGAQVLGFLATVCIHSKPASERQLAPNLDGAVCCLAPVDHRQQLAFELGHGLQQGRQLGTAGNHKPDLTAEAAAAAAAPTGASAIRGGAQRVAQAPDLREKLCQLCHATK